MLTRLAIALATVAALVAVPATAANAADCHDSTGAPRSGYGLGFAIDKVKPGTGQVMFTVTPKGFTYVKVSDEGEPNVKGEGHAHVYAKDVATGKVRYIGWTGNGLTDWSDPGRLKVGVTYRIYAVFSENDHTEVPTIRSKAVTVTIK